MLGPFNILRDGPSYIYPFCCGLGDAIEGILGDCVMDGAR